MKTTGNTILITGGGSGIGRKLAQRFNALGNTVIVAGRRMETLEETIAGRQDMYAVAVDVDDRDHIREFAGRVLTEHPALNVLVNNAGIMRREDLSGKRDLRDAEQTITTNLLAPIRLTNELIDHLIRQSEATIVNVSSGLAFVPMSSTPTYNATKAAIHSYTRSRCANSSRERSRSSSLHRLRCKPNSHPANLRAKAICPWPPLSTRQ